MALVDTTRPEPSATEDTLKYKRNTFAFFNESVTPPHWEYYKCTVGSLNSTGKFISIINLPPLLEEGFIAYEKEIYKVTVRDLLRRRINVASKYTPSGTSSAGNRAIATPTDPSMGGRGIENRNQPRLENSSECRISQDADLAWNEQVGAILHLLDPEEGWDVP